MQFSDLAWTKNITVYNSIIKHPFNQKLAKGSLDQAKFNYYIEQDSLYLYEFAKCLATIASRLTISKHILEFLDLAKGAFVAEQEVVHSHFKKALNYSATNKITTACLGYTSYLHACTKNKSIEAAIASILPCFWVYYEVGKQLKQNSTLNNIYAPWINNYSSEKFAVGVEKVIEIANYFYNQANLETQQSMLDSFSKSMLWELHFWNDAYYANYFESIVVFD